MKYTVITQFFHCSFNPPGVILIIQEVKSTEEVSQGLVTARDPLKSFYNCQSFREGRKRAKRKFWGSLELYDALQTFFCSRKDGYLAFFTTVLLFSHTNAKQCVLCIFFPHKLGKLRTFSVALIYSFKQRL